MFVDLGTNIGYDTDAALSDRNGAGFLDLNEENLGDHRVYDAENNRTGCAIQLLDFPSSFDLSMFLVDRIGQSLIPCTDRVLRNWTRQTDADPTNEGFVNILLAPA